jgi:putative hemolysin
VSTVQTGRKNKYPAATDQLPDFEIKSGKYLARFARDAAELDLVLQLRYDVFNLELNEGLDESHASGRDADSYDAGFHHLMILEKSTGAVIGTYRMQTSEMARNHAGFYSEDEFDFSALPKSFLDDSVELGRACVAKDHRNGRVLYLLWRGLIRYLLDNNKRFLFGCSSLTSQSPDLGKRVMEFLAESNHIHPSFRVEPREKFRCYDDSFVPDSSVEPSIPRLMRLYLSYDSKICGSPAMDRQFKTIDFFTVFDAVHASGQTRKLLF